MFDSEVSTWPVSLLPQHTALPSVSMAHAWWPPRGCSGPRAGRPARNPALAERRGPTRDAAGAQPARIVRPNRDPDPGPAAATDTALKDPGAGATLDAPEPARLAVERARRVPHAPARRRARRRRRTAPQRPRRARTTRRRRRRPARTRGGEACPPLSPQHAPRRPRPARTHGHRAAVCHRHLRTPRAGPEPLAPGAVGAHPTGALRRRHDTPHRGQSLAPGRRNLIHPAGTPRPARAPDPPPSGTGPRPRESPPSAPSPPPTLPAPSPESPASEQAPPNTITITITSTAAIRRAATAPVEHRRSNQPPQPPQPDLPIVVKNNTHQTAPRSHGRRPGMRLCHHGLSFGEWARPARRCPHTSDPLTAPPRPKRRQAAIAPRLSRVRPAG